MDTMFYKIVKPFVWIIVKIFFHPQVIGKENIPKEGRILLAGNHTKWKDPVTLVGISKRQIHFLAKDELFHGITKFIVKGMGAIPVNRRIHDKDALINAKNLLEKDLCVGIFPEGTVNKTDNIILPFKVGAVKMGLDTNTRIVPFIITGKYKVFGKSVKIEFLKPITLSKSVDIENNRLMEIISNKLQEEKNHER